MTRNRLVLSFIDNYTFAARKRVWRDATFGDEDYYDPRAPRHKTNKKKRDGIGTDAYRLLKASSWATPSREAIGESHSRVSAARCHPAPARPAERRKPRPAVRGPRACRKERPPAGPAAQSHQRSTQGEAPDADSNFKRRNALLRKSAIQATVQVAQNPTSNAKPQTPAALLC
ncbi:hypothetical protein NDU88_008473 [Pleurodeles waltl]|uniref:Uncharacterized protein n=1 Tax=Pleurodeles waltl TaxID=8319 RepID=A0AAV7NXX5_PLEWA|nr:hypothetical protein NDU88_008473 [Pleurodeles waltl]